MNKWLMWITPILIVFSGVCFSKSNAPDSALDQMVSDVVESRIAGKPGQVLSPVWGKKLQLDTAYRVQREAVKQWLGDRVPEGFKAGLTSPVGQKKFGVKQPVAGVLLPGSKRVAVKGHYTVHSKEFNRPMMEAEIGFRLNEAIAEPIKDINELKSKVASIVPVIELPDLAFSDPKSLKGVDIIANNVAAKQYIVGAEMGVKDIDVDSLVIVVQRNNKSVLQGRGSDAMGSQWQALLWLINQTVASGWEIQPGQLLITGALGKMLPAQLGQYQVDFGSLGRIDFLID